MPLKPPVVVRDAALRKRFEEAVVFSFPAHSRPHYCSGLLRIDHLLLKNS